MSTEHQPLNQDSIQRDRLIDSISDTFEKMYFGGESPQIEAFLDRVDGPTKQPLLAKISGLRSLELVIYNAVDLNPIPNLEQLRSLTITSLSDQGLARIQKLQSLESLHIKLTSGPTIDKLAKAFPRLLARRLAKSPRTPATTDSKATEPESVATQSAATPESAAPMSSRYSSDQLKVNSPHAAFAQFTDGTNETLLAGTVSEGRSVPWTKPDDIRLDDTFLSKENSFVEGYFMFADGSIHYIHIEDDLDPAKFRALFTINGGEPHTFANLYPQGKKFTSPRFEIRQSQARMKISNSLKDIAVALLNYHVAYKHLPPAIVYGPDGKPWHS